MLLKKQEYLSKKRFEIILECGAVIILGLSPINIILSIISIVLVIKNTKNISSKDKTMIKSKDLPKLKQIYLKNYKLIMGTVVLFAYLFSEYWWSRIPIVFSPWIDQILFDIAFLLLCLLVFSNPLILNIKDYIKNFKLYIKYIYSKLLIFLIIYIPAVLLVVYITKNKQSLNQELLESLPNLYVIPSAIIWAPLVEEILFRGILRQIFKNKILFIIISSLLFGLMHTIWEPTLSMVFIQGIPYILMGLLVSYVYVKTDNIYISITCHMILNTLASINILLGL